MGQAEASRRPSISTRPQGTDVAFQLRARTMRRIFVAALVAFLALGALGVYGVRTTSRSAVAGGYEVTVHYASVSRPGLATPWSFDVRRPGGFPDGLTVAALSSYFDAFDENGLSPSPEYETDDGEWTLWRFPASTADTMTVSFDARIEPGVQLTRVKGRLQILPAGPRTPPAVTVAFSTFVVP